MTDIDPSTAKATPSARLRLERSRRLTDEALVAVANAANALDLALRHWTSGADRKASRLLMEHMDEYLEERGR